MMSRSPSLVSRTVVALTAALAVVAIAAGCGRSETAEAKAPNEPEATEVAATDARVGDVSQTLAISGSLVPQTRVDVRSKLPGRLERVLVDIGDASQPARLSPRSTRARSTRRSMPPRRR